MPHTSADGLTMLPEPAAWTTDDAIGLTAAHEPLAEGLSALAGAMDVPPAPAPHPPDHLHRSMAALCRREQPQTAAWRGLLALCLLADAWTDGPTLTVRKVNAQTSPLAGALLADATLRLVYLEKESQCHLLGVASAEAGILPAAEAADLSDWLPERVAWYDRAAECFTDPAPLLNEHDRALLLHRLTAMKSATPVADFIADLTREGVRPAQEAARQDEAALRALVIRVKAAAGLAPEKELAGLTTQTAGYRASAGNPLLDCLGLATPAESAPLFPQTTWLWHGVPFARSCAALGLESSGAPGESAALNDLAEEIALLERFSPRWRQALPGRLSEWLIGHGGAALSPAARKAVEEAKRQVAAFAPDEGAQLAWPFRRDGGAAQLICHECLDNRWQAALVAPFSDRLCLLPLGSLGDEVLARACTLYAAPDEAPCAVLPPLSVAMAQCALGGSELRPEGFSFAPADGGVRASITLQGKRSLTLTHVYGPENIIRLSAEDVPTLAVWPAAAFAGDAWRAYYAYLHGGSLQARILRRGEWIATQDRLFSVTETERFPAAILLYQESRCLGAVLAPQPPLSPARTEPVIAGLELGASGAASILRQGLRSQPLKLPSLVRTILRGGRPAPMAEEFLPALPLGPVLPAAAELFNPEGDAPLTDGHILLSTAESAADKNLVYDLKWSVDKVSARARQLYLHQLMMTVSLAAALAGAPSISWRVALPEDMTEQGRRSLYEAVAELAPIVSAHTGLPLTADVPPVVHSDASMALGAYTRGEGGIRGGFLSMDWGGGSLSLALWLRGMNRPAVRCCLPLGIQTLLAELPPDALKRDFAELPDPAARRCVMLLADQIAAAQGSRSAFDKARYLLDACLGEHLPALTAHTNARYAAGKITDLQARLTVLAASALTMAGMIQEQTWRDPLLNDYLPANMTLALSGRGSILLATLPQAVQARLMRFMRLMMGADHPVHDLQIAPSAAPKCETALGLVRLTEVSDARPGKALPLRPNAPLPLPPDALITRFLSALRFELPEVCEALYPGLFEADGRLTLNAAGLIHASAMRHFTPAAAPEAAFAACLAEIRALP